MTDPITCPDCDGEGEHVLGPMRFLCCFCHGTGEVGGDNEPAERGHDAEYDPYSDPSPTPVRGVPGCGMCLGSGVVVNVGDVRNPSKLIESACPACAPSVGRRPAG